MKLHHISNWHRYLGLTISLFVVLLAITGVLLLHTDDLNLQQRFMNNPQVLNWYGISADGEPRAFSANQNWIIQVDERLYLNGDELPSSNEDLQGAVVSGEYLVIAFENSLYLMTFDGALIERMMQAQGVPDNITGIASADGEGVVLQTPRGDYVSDADLVAWSPLGDGSPQWSRMKEAPAEQLDIIMAQYRGEGLSLERVLLDVHSGRILGRYGPWLMDIIAVLFLVLSLTGWWSWIKRRALQRELD